MCVSVLPVKCPCSKITALHHRVIAYHAKNCVKVLGFLIQSFQCCGVCW